MKSKRLKGQLHENNIYRTGVQLTWTKDFLPSVYYGLYNFINFMEQVGFKD